MPESLCHVPVTPDSLSAVTLPFPESFSGITLPFAGHSLAPDQLPSHTSIGASISPAFFHHRHSFTSVPFAQPQNDMRLSSLTPSPITLQTRETGLSPGMSAGALAPWERTTGVTTAPWAATSPYDQESLGHNSRRGRAGGPWTSSPPRPTVTLPVSGEPGSGMLSTSATKSWRSPRPLLCQPGPRLPRV